MADVRTKPLAVLASQVGWPRLIIALFLLSLFVAAPFVNVRLDSSIGDTLTRFGMNGILVLALVPMVQSGCGLNFGLPLGIIAGLLGGVLSIEFGLRGLPGFFGAILLSLPFAIGAGYGYGKLLNRVKGDEMMIATYVGFSSVAVMCMGWLLLPLKNPTMVWGYGGTGLRTTISADGYWIQALDSLVPLPLGENLRIPLGTIGFFAILALAVWAFFRTRVGTAMMAVGANPVFARASGINIDRMRLLSVVLSTVLGAVGILVYQQSFGFIQLYMAPLYLAFPAVAAILLGGASVNRATLLNVIVGTFLFQGILTMTPSVINSLIETDMSEVIRIVVSNGMILYALTRRSGGGA